MGGTPSPNAHQSHNPAAPDTAASLDRAAGDGDIEVVRSEERLRLGIDVTVSGRAVLRKYIVTETVTQTFQVRREEVRLEHEPATDAQAPQTDAAVFDGRVVKVTLHREVPVVQMKVVPTEQVLLHVDTVTEQVEVAADLRKEQLGLNTTS